MNKVVKSILVIGALAGLSTSAEFGMKPIHGGVFTTLGMFQGDTITAAGNSGVLEKKPFVRYGAWVNVAGSVSERTDFSLLLAAMHWNSLPTTKGSAFTRNQSLSPGLGHAYLSHKLGDLQDPYLTLKFGDINYRYSDSKNLGGHLYTSGAYPGYLDGNYWELVDGANYGAQGAVGSFSFLENTLKVDATLFLEHGIEPHFDLSPGIVASYKIGNILEIGAGAVFAHLISVDEDRTTPKNRKNAYFNGKPLSEQDQQGLGLELTDTLIVNDTLDPKYKKFLASDDPRKEFLESNGKSARYLTSAENGTSNSQLSYYTFRGTKLMGRFRLTPFEPLFENTAPMGLYGEINVLGVKNYPFYYEKITERMPVLIGLDFPMPTFDLNVEVEYYKNKFRNNIQQPYEFELPIWQENPSSFQKEIKDVSGKVVSTVPVASHSNAPLYWSVRARKSFYSDKLAFNLKLARDFVRPVNFFGNPTFEPAFREQNQWYLIFKTDISI